MRKHLSSILPIVVAGILLAGACSAGGSDDEDTSGSGGTDATVATEATAPSATFPDDPRADGVTDDAIKVGVTYVDLAALGDVVDLDHGDYEAAYQAVADDINADGGINGREIELVFAPVVPIGTAPADEACTKLTQDEQVFAVLGFMIDDTPLCYVATHNTPAIGGVITQARLDQATAPWFSNVAGAETVTTGLVEAFAADGAFDDATVGVIAVADDQDLMDDVTIPALEAQGVEVAESAVIDAPADDQAAALQQVGVIAERFEAAGVDTVVTVANAALPTARGFEATTFRPRLLATGSESLATYINASDGFDADVVEDALSGGYATGIVQFDDPAMADCLTVVEDATGVTVPDPETLSPGDPELHVSVFAACMQLTMFRQIAEAAGDELNNGTFGQAGYALGETEIPGAAGPATFGPESLDGAMPIYLLRFDADAGRLLSDTEPT